MRKFIVAAVAAGLLCALTASAQQVLVRAEDDLKVGFSGGSPEWLFGTCGAYDNSVNTQPFLIPGRDEDHGDDVTMDGGGLATNIMLQIHSLGGDHNADVRVRLFEGGNDPGVPPGAMLWESEVFPQMLILGGNNDYNFPIDPPVVVPAVLTFTTELLNVTGGLPDDQLGARIVFPPVVGFTEDFSWQHFPDGSWTAWIWNDAKGNPVPVGQGARIDIECDDCPDPCDTNCDDLINSFDIEPFIDLLFDENLPPCCGERGDIGGTGDTNGDGLVNAFDIEGFLECLFP